MLVIDILLRIKSLFWGDPRNHGTDSNSRIPVGILAKSLQGFLVEGSFFHAVPPVCLRHCRCNHHLPQLFFRSADASMLWSATSQRLACRTNVPVLLDSLPSLY